MIPQLLCGTDTLERTFAEINILVSCQYHAARHNIYYLFAFYDQTWGLSICQVAQRLFREMSDTADRKCQVSMLSFMPSAAHLKNADT